MNTTTKVLIAIGAFIVAFIITMIVMYWIKDSVPDTLIQYTLGAGGLEALLCAGITIAKELKRNRTEPEPEKESDGEHYDI